MQDQGRRQSSRDVSKHRGKTQSMRSIPTDKQEISRAARDLLREAEGRRRDSGKEISRAPSLTVAIGTQEGNDELSRGRGLPPRSRGSTCKAGATPRLGPRPHTVQRLGLSPHGPLARRVTLSVTKNGRELRAPIPTNVRLHAEKNPEEKSLLQSHTPCTVNMKF